MWQVSVIFVHTMTELYQIPMLWCGVFSETLGKKQAYRPIFGYEKKKSEFFLKKICKKVK